MADLQKTIKGLRCHSEPKFGPDEYFCETCPYDEATCGLDVPNDALSLLKAQQARLMTAEELENALDTVVWIETKDLQENSSSQYALLESYSRKYGYFYLLHLRKEHPSVYPYTNINKTWRPWNIRPTDEQRKAVKWDG